MTLDTAAETTTEEVITPPEEAQETPQTEGEVQEETTESESAEPQEEATEEKPKKKSTPISERVKQIAAKTAEMREAERRSNEAAEKLEKLQQKFNQIKPPNPDEFDDIEAYNTQKQDYDNQLIEQRAAKIAQERVAQQQAQERQAETARKWEYEKAKAVEKDPNFINHEAKVERVLKMYNRVAYAQPILESEKSAEIVSFLGKNDQHLERLAGLSPDMVLKEIGALEYKLGQQPKKQPTKAPEPINPVGGGTGAPKSLEQMSLSEFEAFRNKQESGR